MAAKSLKSLIHLDQAGATVKMFAPDINQMHVIDHTTGEEMVRCGSHSCILSKHLTLCC